MNVADMINTLNLEQIKLLLVVKEGWMEQEADMVFVEYRKFLLLKKNHPHEKIVPWFVELDSCWHWHMLDSRKYREDCKNIFGYYLDHDPHFSEDGEDYRRAKKKTADLYAAEFGEVLPDYEVSPAPSEVNQSDEEEPIFLGSFLGKRGQVINTAP